MGSGNGYAGPGHCASLPYALGIRVGRCPSQLASLGCGGLQAVAGWWPRRRRLGIRHSRRPPRHILGYSSGRGPHLRLGGIRPVAYGGNAANRWSLISFSNSHEVSHKLRLPKTNQYGELLARSALIAPMVAARKSEILQTACTVQRPFRLCGFRAFEKGAVSSPSVISYRAVKMPQRLRNEV